MHRRRLVHSPTNLPTDSFIDAIGAARRMADDRRGDRENTALTAFTLASLAEIDAFMPVGRKDCFSVEIGSQSEQSCYIKSATSPAASLWPCKVVKRGNF